MIRRPFATAFLLAWVIAMGFAQSTGTSPAATGKKVAPSDLAVSVAQMARIGSANSPSFSSDGKWVSFVSNTIASSKLLINEAVIRGPARRDPVCVLMRKLP